MTAGSVFQIVLDTARPVLSSAGRASLLEALPTLSPSDWARVVQQSVQHGTTGLLCHHLLTTDRDEPLPDDMRVACRAYLASSQQSHVRSLQELQRLLQAFDAAGVAVLPIKGPGLASRIYPEPGLRSARDLDLLVRPEQRDAALSVLASLGYRSRLQDLPPSRLRDYHAYNGQDILFAPDRLPVEPHWALAPRTLSADIDVAGLFERSVDVDAPWLGRRRALSPEDTLIFAALHGAKEEWSRLIWLSDLAALFAAWPTLDGSSALDRASACGCRRMLLLAALLAHDLMGAPVPAVLVDAARRDRVAVRLAASTSRRIPLSRGETRHVFSLTLLRWQVRERAADRLRYGWRTLFTPRVVHFRAVALPDRLAVLYPLVRIGRDAVALPGWKAWKAWKNRGDRAPAS